MDALADPAPRQLPVAPTYRLGPHGIKRFSPAAVRRVCEEVVAAHLAGKQWVGDEEGILTVSITEAITERVKALGFDRYKLVVQVALGENRAQGVHVACRGLWDADSDNYATYAFKSDTLWCSALVFGLYVE